MKPKASKDMLSLSDLPNITGLTLPTIRKYRCDGTLPQQDGIVGATPWWYRSTIEKWMQRPKSKGGRPPVMTPELIAEARRLREKHASYPQIANQLGVGLSTVKAALKKQ